MESFSTADSKCSMKRRNDGRNPDVLVQQVKHLMAVEAEEATFGALNGPGTAAEKLHH